VKVGIVGCGFIGKKRANNLQGAELVACADYNLKAAESLASQSPNAKAYDSWQALLDDSDAEIIIIATPHNALAEIALASVKANKHILIEKPAARSYKEIEPVLDALKKHKVKARVGFNHRYHRSLQKAKKIIDEGQLGELMFVRARYGHGGRLGYEKEWRAKPELSGGGELIDQGVHLIDLSRWILGDFSDVQGRAHTYYWDMPVDDNAFLLMKTPEKKTAFLHVSCTEWKNTFSMEIYGRDGKLDLSGLGGSYGTERLSFYKMLPEMGPPETTMWEYPMADNSWAVEFKEFLEDIRLDREPAASLNDAYQALKIVDTIYEESEL